MKAMHAHFAVDDLAAGVRFYSTLFASAPTVLSADYAKWTLDAPHLSFSIARRGAAEAPGRHGPGLRARLSSESSSAIR